MAKKQPNRQGRAFNFWASEELAEALDTFMKSLEYETKYRTHLQKALEEYLEKRGFWPRKPDRKT